jgi:fibronectin-binding autotransporter adhesin
MAQILDLGKLRFNWKGSYSDSIEYSYNDLVKYGPNLYAYKNATATTATLPTNNIYWVLVTEGITYRGDYTTFSTGVVLYKNDIVVDGTSTYIITEQHAKSSMTLAQRVSAGDAEIIALGQEGLPNQASNVNKVLSTDGTSAIWSDTLSLSKEYIGNTQGAAAESFETSAGLTNAISVYSGSTNDFVQLPIVNTANGANASTDFIAYTADGDNDTGWIDMGITSNNFNSATYGITGPHDGYVFMSGARGAEFEVVSRRTLSNVATLTTSLPHGFSIGDQVRVIDAGTGYDGIKTITAIPSVITFSYAKVSDPESETPVSPSGTTWKPKGDGNLVLATTENGKENKIVFAAGGLSAGNTQMSITPDTNVHIEISTQSTSATTGALTVVGGAGISGNLNIAGDLDVNGDVDFSGVQHLPIGTNAFTFSESLTNPVITAVANKNDYQQIAFKNESAHPNASTDFIAYSNNGTDEAGYIDMGITSSAFNDPSFTVTGPGDGYIFMVGATGGTDKGNLVLATGDTGSENRIVFAAGGLTSNNTQMVIIPDDRVHIEIPSASTSPTTGALTVVGGVGIQGDVNIQGSITFGGAGTQLTSENISVNAPFIFTGADSVSQTNDLGIVTEGKYILSGSIPARTVVNKSLIDNVATLTTLVNHSFLVGDSVAVVNVDGTFDGTYTITAKTDTTFSYAKSAGNVSSARIGDVTFSINNKVLTGEVATLTTTATHSFLAGETVVVTGVDSTFNGTYTITTPITATTFSYAKPTASNVPSAPVSPVGTAVVNRSTATGTVANPVRTRYNSWSKDATDSVWKLASNIITEPTTTIDYGQSGITYDGIKVGSVDASSLTLSSTLTGGASSNIAINTDKFTINATSGNTSIGGTLGVTGNSTLSGTLGVTGTSTFTGAATFNGGVNITGVTQIAELREEVGNVTLSSNVGTFDWSADNVFYISTAPTANMTFNFTNVPTDNDYIMTTNVLVTQGATGRIPSALNINGASATIRWVNGVAPTPTSNAGKIDIFSFSFLRTGSTWIVFGSANNNF